MVRAAVAHRPATPEPCTGIRAGGGWATANPTAMVRRSVVNRQGSALGHFKQQDLSAAGFMRFVALADLVDPQGPERKGIPHKPGVYVILRRNPNAPSFTEHSCGGKSPEKRNDASRQDLAAGWVDGTELIYVGEGADLRDRVAQLVRFGRGTTDGHAGGKWIWRIEDCWSLVLGYQRLESKEAAVEAEGHLLSEFKRQFDVLPFANRKDGTRRAGAGG